MPRSFELSADSPASVDQVHSAFGDSDYWAARLTTFGARTGTATLDSLAVDDAGTVVVTATFGLVRDGLPKFVGQLGGGDLRMVHTETWSRIDGGRVGGRISVAVPGTPISALGAAVVVPVRNGSQLTYTATVEVKLPFVGGKVESFMGSRLADGILDIMRFTTEWIVENRSPRGVRDESGMT